MSISSATGQYLSTSTASMTVAPTATYHLEVQGSSSVETNTLNYDEIFDLELTSNANVVSLLSLMTVGNVQLTESSPNAATCTAANDGDAGAGVAVLNTILKTAVSGSSQTAQQYLQSELNSVVNGSLTSSSTNYHVRATASNISNYVMGDLEVNIDADSGVITISDPNYLAAAKSVADVAFNTADMINQIPYSTLVKYDNGANGITTTHLPVLLGDYIIFGVSVAKTPIAISATATTFASATGADGRNTGTFGVSLTSDSQDDLPARVLAFRVKVSGAGTAGDAVPY